MSYGKYTKREIINYLQKVSDNMNNESEKNKKEAADYFNEGHIPEAQDRTFLCIEFVSSSLMYHPAICKAGLNKEIDKVVEILNDVYQRLGDMED